MLSALISAVSAESELERTIQHQHSAVMAYDFSLDLWTLETLCKHFSFQRGRSYIANVMFKKKKKRRRITVKHSSHAAMHTMAFSAVVEYEISPVSVFLWVNVSVALPCYSFQIDLLTFLPVPR